MNGWMDGWMDGWMEFLCNKIFEFPKVDRECNNQPLLFDYLKINMV